MAGQKSPHRTANFAQAAVYTVIVIAILATLNFLGNRYNQSHDFTQTKKFTLSDQTEKIVKNLKQDITITYWGQPDKFQQAKDLLDRYQNISRKVDVKYEDVEKRRTQAIAAGVKLPLPNIFVEVGNKKELAKSLTEEEVSGAIVRSIKGGDRTICFVLGSGERSIDDQEADGLAGGKMLAERSNYKTQTIKLAAKPEIPMECTVVVVPGPDRDYLPAEVTALKNFVEDGGRALFMLDPPLKLGAQQIDENAALTAVLASWGVTVDKDVVRDPGSMTETYGPVAPVVQNYESQPIVREMKTKSVYTVFPLTRSLQVKNGDKTTVEKLFSTTEEATATTNLSSPEAPPSKTDLKGPLVLAAAGKFNNGKENGPGMFVVVGSSRWAANDFLGLVNNRDLYTNMLNWLSSDEDLISIRPKEPDDRPLNMNQKQLNMVLYSSVFGLPILIVIAGVGVWWRRR